MVSCRRGFTVGALLLRWGLKEQALRGFGLARLAPEPVPKALVIPAAASLSTSNDVNVTVDGRDVRLTNLQAVLAGAGHHQGRPAPVLRRRRAGAAAAIADRAMVMRPLPERRFGESFFIEEAPSPRPPWIRICPIHHNDEKVVNFPVIDDLPSLLWVVNLGCIDLNQWYARCEDYNRPDYLHFDLDPSPGATFDQGAGVGARRARGARDAEDEAAREDQRLARLPRARADRARARRRTTC